MTPHPIDASSRFKKRVPATIEALPGIVQLFVKFICKSGIDKNKPRAAGNLGFDSGYDWSATRCTICCTIC